MSPPELSGAGTLALRRLPKVGTELRVTPEASAADKPSTERWCCLQGRDEPGLGADQLRRLQIQVYAVALQHNRPGIILGEGGGKHFNLKLTISLDDILVWSIGDFLLLYLN